ncbi:MAG: hypothetical protein AAGG38_08645, partial [Planctomycetota bacterium]
GGVGGGQDDPRLEAFGLPGAEVEVVLDPRRLRPETVGRGQTDRDGRFAVAVDEAGAGLLILDVEVRATRRDFVSVAERLELPGGGKRLVVTMPRGADGAKPGGGNLLDETLRDAEPYLRD